jgi:hypothetical protein
MNTRKLILPSLVLALALGQPAFAQKASEQFIPLGQSPGLSGEATLLGTIQAVDPNTGNVTIHLDKGGSKIICVLPKTRLWQDRSPEHQPNRKCELQDLKPGQRVEAMPQKGDTTNAEWLKVQKQ